MSFGQIKYLFGKVGLGMQKWIKWYDENVRLQIYFHYTQDEKWVDLYTGDNETNCESFSIRNIVSVLKRRGY